MILAYVVLLLVAQQVSVQFSSVQLSVLRAGLKGSATISIHAEQFQISGTRLKQK